MSYLVLMENIFVQKEAGVPKKLIKVEDIPGLSKFFYLLLIVSLFAWHLLLMVLMGNLVHQITFIVPALCVLWLKIIYPSQGFFSFVFFNFLADQLHWVFYGMLHIEVSTFRFCPHTVKYGSIYQILPIRVKNFQSKHLQERISCSSCIKPC